MAYDYVWPPSLPRAPRRDGYSEQGGANVLRTPMDAGPAKQRRRSRRPAPVQCVYRLTADQVQTLTGFIDNTLRGVARFGWPHPRTRQVVEARVVPAEQGLYTIAPVRAGWWDVTLSVEVLP